MQSTVRQAAAKPRLSITSLGTSAALPKRGSITANATSASSEPAAIASTRGSVTPQSADWSNARSRSTSPSESVTIPA